MKAIEIIGHFYLEAILGSDWNQKNEYLCPETAAELLQSLC
jgi:hypothetical protein